MEQVEKVEQALQEESKPIEQAPATTEDSGTHKVETPEDPEFDLGVDEKGQPLKFKKSQILEFQKGNMLQSDYTRKTQDIATQKEEIKEMFNIVEHLKKFPKKAERIISILDEKEEALQEQKDEIDTLLKDLPADDPYTKGLLMLKTQTAELIKSNKLLQNKLDTYEQKTQAVEQGQAVKQAEVVLNKALDETVKQFKFEDEEDKSDWRRAVLTWLVNNPKEYGSEDEMKGIINQIGKIKFDTIVKRNEKIIGRYIKTKSGDVPTHPAGGAAKPLTKKPSMDNLQESIEEALANEEKQNT